MYKEYFDMIQNQKTWNLKYKYKNIFGKQKENIVGNIEKRDNEIIILFQGSDGLGDWILNFLSWPFRIREPYKNMPINWYVHYGIFKRFKQIKELMIDKLYKLLEPSIDRIYVIGYSQGGAIATYAAEAIAWEMYDVFWLELAIELTCITFGAPHCVDKNGRRILSRRIPIHNTICYGNDIVTKIPWWFWRPWEVAHIGPKRKWWKLSIKDHKRYGEEK